MRVVVLLAVLNLIEGLEIVQLSKVVTRENFRGYLPSIYREIDLTNVFPIVGTELAFVCRCNLHNCDSEEIGLGLNRNGKVATKQIQNSYYSTSLHALFVINVTKDLRFGNYTCELGQYGEKSNESFSLKYILCEDESDECQNLECSESSQNQYQFCILNESNKRCPSTCQAFQDNECPEKDIYDAVYCIETKQGARSFSRSLCRLYAEQQLISFVARDKETCYDLGNYIKIKGNFRQLTTENGNVATSNAIREIPFAFIGRSFEKQTDSSDETIRTTFHVQYNCASVDPNCNVQCYEVTSANWLRREYYKLSSNKVVYHFSYNYSTVSKFGCDVHYGNIFAIFSLLKFFVFNVRLSAKIRVYREYQFDGNSNKNGGRIVCKFSFPPEPQRRKLFKTHMQIVLDGTRYVEIQKNVTEMTIKRVFCGKYICFGYMKIRHCNPFYEDEDYANSTIIIRDSCENYEDDKNSRLHSGLILTKEDFLTSNKSNNFSGITCATINVQGVNCCHSFRSFFHYFIYLFLFCQFIVGNFLL